LDTNELQYWEIKAAERLKEIVSRHCLNCKNLIKIKSDPTKIKNLNIKKDKRESRNCEKNEKIKSNINNYKYNKDDSNLNNKIILNKSNPETIYNNKSIIEEEEKNYNLLYNKNSFVKYYKFPIIKPLNRIENPIQECLDPHIICELCVDIVHHEILNRIRLRSQKGKKEKIRIAEIKCIICLKEHQLEFNEFKKIVKTGFQRCCSIL